MGVIRDMGYCLALQRRLRFAAAGVVIGRRLGFRPRPLSFSRAAPDPHHPDAGERLPRRLQLR